MNGRRYTGQQSGKKSGLRPADINRWFCFPIVLHFVPFVRASRDTPRIIFFDRLAGERVGCLLPDRPVGVLS